MSTGFNIVRWICKIGKKVDKNDCTNGDCDNCRHWIQKEVWQDCMKCKKDCIDCPIDDWS